MYFPTFSITHITFKTTDINDIITNTVGTIIRYFIARWITGS